MEYELCTPGSYDAAVKKIDKAGYNPSVTGHKCACILHKIPNFYVTLNYAPDAMCYLLEGITLHKLEAGRCW